MLNSLYSKIAVGFASIFLVVGLIFVWITVFSTEMYQQEVNQKLNTNLASQIVKERLLMEKGKVNKEALKDIFHMLMVINPGIEIYLLDTRGKILTFSAPKGSVKRDAVDLEPVLKWMELKPESPTLGDDPKSLHRKKVFSVAPIQRNGNLEGYLYVILGGEQYDSVAQKLKASYILQLSAWMIAGGLLFALISGLVLFGVLTGRLKRLAKVMDDFKRGDGILSEPFSYQPSKGGKDEIDRLSITFQEMATRIERQMEELEDSDKMRRELVANVSHDLRTPLATLQGYIETLLIKENQYSPRERKQYLEIAIQHCQRLNTLVSELLELARLESAQMRIDPEPFNLLELCQDVVQKFMLAAEDKQVTLTTQFTEPVDFVLADIFLIERALENLIENALHYTPQKGSVTITIEQKESILVAIQDTGSGICKEDLKHIFKRFSHSGSGKRNKDGHSGLGLAITHKIVELHHGQLQVQSTPGQGSCFSFSLPVYDHKKESSNTMG